MRFCLFVVPADGDPEFEAEIGDSLFRVGRSPDCDLMMPSTADTVSAFHAEFRLLNGALQVQDTGSRNGTYVDGKRIAAWTTLRHGSTIRLGRQGPTLRWRAVGAARAADDSANDERGVTTRFTALRTWCTDHRQLVLGAAAGAAIVLLVLLVLLLFRG
jgi:predicted component of type VI protein secretion system